MIKKTLTGKNKKLNMAEGARFVFTHNPAKGNLSGFRVLSPFLSLTGTLPGIIIENHD